jgi:hypothetical protein
VCMCCSLLADSMLNATLLLVRHDYPQLVCVTLRVRPSNLTLARGSTLLPMLLMF